MGWSWVGEEGDLYVLVVVARHEILVRWCVSGGDWCLVGAREGGVGVGFLVPVGGGWWCDWR